VLYHQIKISFEDRIPLQILVQETLYLSVVDDIIVSN